MSKILYVVAHPDDAELMAGGTIARQTAEKNDVTILVMADGVTSRDYPNETIDEREDCAIAASNVLGCDVEFVEMPDNRLDSVPILDIIKAIEEMIAEFEPDIVFTHWHGDMNIDHRIVCGATLTACRPQPGCRVKSIFMGEVPSSTEWAGGFIPNYYVKLSVGDMQKKQQALSCYGEEMRGMWHPRSMSGVHTLAKYRGVTIGEHMAEAFILHRGVHP